MRIFRNKLVLLTLITHSVTSFGDASPNGIQLKNLFSNETVMWTRHKTSGPELFVYFQPDCLSCRRQAKQLQCMTEEAVIIRYVGARSAEKELRQESSRMGVQGRAFGVTERDLSGLGFSEPATPQGALFLGNQVKRWLGAKNCEEVRQLLMKSEKS